MRLILSASVALLIFTACGEEESLPQKPQLRVDRLLIDFGTESGTGTYLGTSPQESMLIRNEGLENLKLGTITKTGDTAFTIEGPLKTELKGKETTFIRVIFKPTAVKQYTGALTIEANHEVTTDWPNPLQINLRGSGVAVPDGGS